MCTPLTGVVDKEIGSKIKGDRNKSKFNIFLWSVMGMNASDWFPTANANR